jgi:hypothetical protein
MRCNGRRRHSPSKTQQDARLATALIIGRGMTSREPLIAGNVVSGMAPHMRHVGGDRTLCSPSGGVDSFVVGAGCFEWFF